MKIKITRNKKFVNEIADLHIRTFQGFFLTFLGKGFLKQLYAGFMDHSQSDVIVALDDDGHLIGFLAFSENISEFYKSLIKKRLIAFAWYAFYGFVRKPKVFFRLIRAFTYSKESKRKEKYIELSSIGVDPGSKNKGVGSSLIQYLIKTVGRKTFQYIKLETDYENNVDVNNFYMKNGFVLDHEYETAEGRKMNEYRFYLRGKKG